MSPCLFISNIQLLLEWKGYTCGSRLDVVLHCGSAGMPKLVLKITGQYICKWISMFLCEQVFGDISWSAYVRMRSCSSQWIPAETCWAQTASVYVAKLDASLSSTWQMWSIQHWELWQKWWEERRVKGFFPHKMACKIRFHNQTCWKNSSVLIISFLCSLFGLDNCVRKLLFELPCTCIDFLNI